MVSPMDTMAMTEPMPMMIPSIVRAERILLDRMAENAIFMFSISILLSSLSIP